MLSIPIIVTWLFNAASHVNNTYPKEQTERIQLQMLLDWGDI